MSAKLRTAASEGGPRLQAVKPARFSFFGPGLVSAASNNDPTTVAALAVVGATTGYELCWLVVLVVPMLALVQAVAASVGAVCKTSLQGAIRHRYGLRWASITLCAVAAVNLFTLAADVKAGGEAIALLTHTQAELYAIPFAVTVGWMLVNHSYGRIERYLSLLPLIFICYIGSAAFAHVDVAALWRGLVTPRLTLSPAIIFGALALLGTTLTAYVYMWETIEVSQRAEAESVGVFRRDAIAGMLSVGLIFVFILVTSAATMGTHHLPVETATDLAATLEPLAGPWAATLFGVGLLGSAVLAVPVIAGTTAYVAAHTFGWSGSLDSSVGSAKAFYAVLLGSLAFAAIVAAFAPVPAVSLLFWASLAGGLATPLTLAFLTLVASSRRSMGSHALSRPMAAASWTLTGVVVAAGAAFLWSLR